VPNLKDWSEFIDARILQERSVSSNQKADDRALTILNKLCDAYPAQTEFLKSRAWSLSVLGKEEDAASSLIEAMYTDLTKRLSGENDKAENWINELEKLKKTIDSTSAGKICTSTMAW